MTAQRKESLSYKGEQLKMATEPLRQYLLQRNDIHFLPRSTGCWRGYDGQWEIIDDKLYLVALDAKVKDIGPVNLQYLFPQAEKVFADWFSGHIKIPLGQLLKYVHMGYESVYEKELILVFEKGILLEEKEKINNL